MALENLELVTPGTSRGWISTCQRDQPPGFRRLDARNQPAPADPGAPKSSPSQVHVTSLNDVFGNRHVDRQVSGLGTPKANKKSRPRLASTIPGRLLERFRRSPTFAPKHYHGPGGLNGRVRNGNGCDPAGMVAGKPAGGLSGHAGRDSAVVGSQAHGLHTPPEEVARPQEPKPTLCHLASASCHSDRIGEATGSLGLAFVRLHDRREPIGVVKLLGC